MPLEGKYLKYSPEITLEIFTLVWDKLIKNGCKFEYSKEIIFDRFKFHDRVLRYDSNGNYVYPLMGSNSCKKTTVQEILGYDPFVKDDFVLPNKWCIKTTKDENGKLIGKWFDEQSKCRCYYNTCLGEYYNSYNLLNESIILGGNLAASFASLNVKEGYTEITFDQFKKYVLKESVEEPKEVIPEYVELLKGFDNTNTGKIFNTTQKIPEMKGWNNIWTWESIFKNDIQQQFFKPSTKEAFDAQNKPIEKWSVGSYVVFLKDNLQANFRKRGDISEITHVNVNIDNITFGDGICNNIDGEFSVVTNLKWFATKSEAEEFAKTLVGSVKHDNGIIDAVELKEFPKEGHCKTNNVELRNYLFKRPSSRTTLESEWIEGKSIGVGWNECSYWVISEKSSRPEYQLSQLQKFFTKDEVKQPLKQAVHCTTQEEWDFVLSKFNPRNINNNLYKGLKTILVINHPEKHFLGAFGTLSDANTGNYQILSFQEWCDLNGYKMEKEVKSNQEFKVGDYITIIKSNKNWVDSMDKEVGKTVKITSISAETYIEYVGKPYWSFGAKDGHFRHATPEEINNHLISIGQILNLDNQESKIYSFKPLQPNDLELEIQISNPYSEVLIEQSNGKLDRSLSIFPTFEENPLIQITEFEINKNYFIDFKDPYN